MGKRKALPEEWTPSVDAIIDTFYSATEEDRAAGMAWYRIAHLEACKLGTATRGAGTIAALSPQCSWTRNLEMARDVYAGRTPRYTTGRNAAKAMRCDAGEHWSTVLGGPKTRAFAEVIEDPTSASAVVIDRHAFDVALGRVTDDATRTRYLSRAGVYETFAQAYRDAAAELGVTPSEVQAVTWVAWRHSKGLAD